VARHRAVQGLKGSLRYVDAPPFKAQRWQHDLTSTDDIAGKRIAVDEIRPRAAFEANLVNL
jgi:hypothetical protein